MIKKRSRRANNGADTQLSLPFDALPPAPAPLAAVVLVEKPEGQPPLVGEILTTQVDESRLPEQWTLGEREHALLVHHADKYEARLYKAMQAFIVAVIIDVAVNGGLPVAQALLRRYDLPLLNDGMLSGACGLAAIILACAMLYFYARFRTYSVQLWLNLGTPIPAHQNWAKWLAFTLGGVWLAALCMMLMLVIYLSAADAWHLLQNIAWHISPTTWQTETMPAPRAR